MVCALGFATPAWYQYSKSSQEGLWQTCNCGENNRDSGQSHFLFILFFFIEQNHFRVAPDLPVTEYIGEVDII